MLSYMGYEQILRVVPRRIKFTRTQFDAGGPSSRGALKMNSWLTIVWPLVDGTGFLLVS